MTNGDFKEFDSPLVIVLDDKPSMEGEFAVATPHESKNSLFKKAMVKYTNAKVASVSVAIGEPIENIHDKILRLVRGKGVNELVVVYFNGSAGFVDGHYMFKFQGNRSGYFNAYQLIWRLATSQATCLFVLDCDVYTRVVHKWQDAFKCIEVIGRGTVYRDPENETIDNEHDFTLRRCRNLAEFATKNKPIGKGWCKKARTIPQLMQFDKSMVSNPLRVKNGRRDFKYTQVHPKHVDDDGKIHFGYVVPTGASNTTANADLDPGNTSGITNPAFRENPRLFSDEGYISDGERDEDDEEGEELFIPH
ncbi:hypothetical protein CBER1_09106 [Cercospora berteroae]|uniref:Uncharacterized protein n=1 Tax=Cercospora berteroae TaxID=357750 RepID=A0A2S6CAM3_9PEZI|nr:hypothetical protein CBER1_09106 [Cercospora berteroae]